MKIMYKIPLYFSILFNLGIMQYQHINAMEDLSLYAGLDYSVIFDQKKILSHNQFADTLHAEGHDFAKNRYTKEHIAKRLLHALTCNYFRRSKKQSRFTAEFNAENASRSQKLNALLVKDFNTQKKHHALKRSLRQPFYTGLLNIALLGWIPGFFEKDGVKLDATGLLLAQSFGQMLQRINHGFYITYISPAGDPLHSYEEDYARKKRFLSEGLQERIESKFSAARRSNMTLTSVLSFCHTALSLPLTNAIPLNDYFKESPAAIENRIKTILKCGDKAIEETLLNALIHHIARSSLSIDDPETPKSVLYFVGPPGTGKTHMAHAVAQALNVACIAITVPSKNIADLIGTHEHPGILIEALSKKPKKGPSHSIDAVLFFDGIGHLINSDNPEILTALLPFLEPTTKHFYSPYLGVDIGISRFLIILESNSLPDNEGLRSRMEIIQFSSMDKEQKEAIIMDHLLPVLCSSKKEAFNIDIDQFKKTHSNTIQRCIQEDTDPGIRSLQLSVSQMVNTLRRRKAITSN